MNPQPALGQTPRALGLRCPRLVALRPPWSLDSSDARLHRSPGASNREPRQDDVMDQLSETPLNGAEWAALGQVSLRSSLCRRPALRAETACGRRQSEGP